MKRSEARPTCQTFHRCLDPGTFRSNIDSKKYLSWRSPRFPRHRNAMCPKMSQRLGVSGQTSPYLSSTSKPSMHRYTKRHLRPPSLHSTTVTHLPRFTLINTIPSPPTTLHPPPLHTNNTTHHPPTKMSLSHQPPPSLSSLPEELSALIILALPIPALAALSQTNRKFRRLCNWKLHEHRREWLKRTKNWTIFDPWKFFEPNVWDPREMWQRGI